MKTIKVKMITKYASPRGTCAPGKTIDLPSDEAKQLLKGRFAELWEGPESTAQLAEVEEVSFEEMKSSEIRDLLIKEGIDVPEGSLNSDEWRKNAITLLIGKE